MVNCVGSKVIEILALMMFEESTSMYESALGA